MCLYRKEFGTNQKKRIELLKNWENVLCESEFSITFSFFDVPTPENRRRLPDGIKLRVKAYFEKSLTIGLGIIFFLPVDTLTEHDKCLRGEFGLRRDVPIIPQMSSLI